jgi:hypothetical protein
MGPTHQLREKIFETLLKLDRADVLDVVTIQFELEELYDQMVSLTLLPRATIEGAMLRQYNQWLQNRPPEAPPGHVD